MNALPIIIGLAWVSAPGARQDPGPPAVESITQDPKKDPETSPFRPDDELARLLGEKKDDGDPYRTLKERPVLPAMHLRGLLRMRGKDDTAALIEIEGVGSYTVRKDERLAFTTQVRLTGPVSNEPVPTARTEGSAATGVADSPPKTPAAQVRGIVYEGFPIVLLVKMVGREGVLVEVGTLGELMIIR